ncbi:unnamed protein product [Rhizophagus irregularis]|nr:unnamed protein product [Rhizophagus irregularis]
MENLRIQSTDVDELIKEVKSQNSYYYAWYSKGMLSSLLKKDGKRANCVKRILFDALFPFLFCEAKRDREGVDEYRIVEECVVNYMFRTNQKEI